MVLTGSNLIIEVNNVMCKGAGCIKLKREFWIDFKRSITDRTVARFIDLAKQVILATSFTRAKLKLICS